jgi:hypothetical protein
VVTIERLQSNLLALQNRILPGHRSTMQ